MDTTLLKQEITPVDIPDEEMGIMCLIDDILMHILTTTPLYFKTSFLQSYLNNADTWLAATAMFIWSEEPGKEAYSKLNEMLMETIKNNTVLKFKP